MKVIGIVPFYTEENEIFSPNIATSMVGEKIAGNATVLDVTFVSPTEMHLTIELELPEHLTNIMFPEYESSESKLEE